MLHLRAAINVRPPDLYGEHGIVLTVDVIVKGAEGQPFGVLEIDSPIQHAYDEHAIFLAAFANAIAETEPLVIEQNRLLDRRAALLEELKLAGSQQPASRAWHADYSRENQDHRRALRLPYRLDRPLAVSAA